MTAALTALTYDRDAEARAWFVRMLDDDPSQDVLTAWTQWMEAHPDNRAAYEHVCDAWFISGDIEPTRASAAELVGDHYGGVVSVARWRKRSRARLTLVAAAAVVAVLLATTLMWTPFHSQREQLATAKGQLLTAELVDGSSVHLAAATKVRVEISSRQRSVALTQGEALFEVAHDAKRPFVVTTPIAAVTAVGTAFNLDVRAAGVTLYVTEGVVTVAPSSIAGRTAGAEVLRVRAGEQLEMRMVGGRLIAVQDIGAMPPSWWEGRLEYRDEALDVVLEEVNRYRPRPITVAGAGIGNLRYTGTVRLDATDVWARGLEAAFPVTVETSADGIVIKNSTAQLPRGAGRTS